MVEDVVGEWLYTVDRDLQGAINCISAEEPTPEHGAFFVQQAAEKLVKAAMVAEGRRPLHTHDIGVVTASLRDQHLRSAFSTLSRFSKYVVVFRYPVEERAEVPTVDEVGAWSIEVKKLKTDFERWLTERTGETG